MAKKKRSEKNDGEKVLEKQPEVTEEEKSEATKNQPEQAKVPR